MKINNKNFIVGLVILLSVTGILFYNYQDYASPVQDTKNVGDSSGSENSVIETYYTLSRQAQKLYYKQSEGLTKEVPERLVELDQLTIGCFGTDRIIQMSSSDTNLGGQCCGVLRDVEAYNVQLKALDRFIQSNGNIDIIPKDPYDVSVEHAQKLINFDKTITLSESQQATFDKAVRMSHHGGPCCCKCWKWYVMSGLAKKLIVDHGWDENQIAELWDTSSSCGHDHDTNMHQHYDVAEGATNSHGVHSIDNEGHDHEAMEVIDVEATIITNTATLNAGENSKITFELKDNGKPITDLMPHHARKLHVVIISENLEIFGHIHPEDFHYDNNNGKYSVDFTFPKSGKYVIAIDGMIKEGKFSKQFVVKVEGEPKQGQVYTNYDIKISVEGNTEESLDAYTQAVVFSDIDNGGYEIFMDAPGIINSGEEAILSFTVLKDGEPLNDLVTYLDAPIHFAMLKYDLTGFVHAHGTLPGGAHDNIPDNFGPTLELKTTFESAGEYQIIGQIKHQNMIIVFPFTLKV